MRSLAAAISPGDFGFTDWAFAAEAQSEMAVQVDVTRKNNALIIIFLSHRLVRNTYGSRAICRRSSARSRCDGRHETVELRLIRLARRLWKFRKWVKSVERSVAAAPPPRRLLPKLGAYSLARISPAFGN
jgi:hypothetical protein